MFDRAFEFFPSDDVLAARTCARELLAQSEASPALLGQARLLLTAACLHIHAGVGPEPTVGELRDLLVALRAGTDAWTSLASSPIQFVRYAAAEFADAQGTLAPAVELALRALKITAL